MNKSNQIQEALEEIGQIKYEGSDSKNPLAFKYYNPQQQIGDKSMAEHLRYAICYWHNLSWQGNDMFGSAAFDYPWHNKALDICTKVKLKADFLFSLAKALQVPYYCWHDTDVIIEGDNAKETSNRLLKFSDYLQQKQEENNINLLWGTANAFSNKRYSAGAASNPDPEVFAYAASQVRTAMEVTNKLKGENYVLWGGREGYDTLLNTNIKQEQEQLARFMELVIEHKYKIGFKGTILIEPKPKEPTKHQYDFDVATVYGFLKRYGLEKEIKVNIEVNHAILAGHTIEHEIAMADALDIFGSVDINSGDYLLGWDTDQFPTDKLEMTKMMYYILKAGGFTTGGLNFDAKLRRQSCDIKDYFYAHIAGIDAGACGLISAYELLQEQPLENFLTERYKKWNSPLGQDILNKKLSLEQIADYCINEGLNPQPKSGRQEMLENTLTRYIK